MRRRKYFRSIKQPPINADSLQLAETLISRMSAKLDIDKFEDSYEVAVKALVEAKIKNMALPVEETPRQQASNVIDLMKVLRKSIGTDAFRQEATKERKGPATRRYWTGQRAGQVGNQAQVGLRTEDARCLYCDLYSLSVMTAFNDW